MTSRKDAATMWVAHQRVLPWVGATAPAAAAEFHRSLAGYSPTPLVELPPLAEELGVARVLAKDETSRLGLPSFKVLGVSWAVHRLLDGRPPGDRPHLVTATDGNHGRALARTARLLGLEATVYVPHTVHPQAVTAIEGEGAVVVPVHGSYDVAVAAAADYASTPGRALVQDTAFEGYEEVPSWIVEGYETILLEVDEQLKVGGAGAPDLVVVPVGVGSLLQAVITHYRHPHADGRTSVVGVEPVSAAFLPASLATGLATTVDTSTTIMAGLNCGTASALAWPVISAGIDGAVTVTDPEAAQAGRDLASLGVPAGPCGAASLAGLRRVLSGPQGPSRAQHVGVGAHSTVILLVTEGSDANPLSPSPS